MVRLTALSIDRVLFQNAHETASTILPLILLNHNRIKMISVFAFRGVAQNFMLS